MVYRERKAKPNSYGSLKFDTIAELIEKTETLRESKIKKISIVVDEVGRYNWLIARNIILDAFSDTDVEIVVFK